MHFLGKVIRSKREKVVYIFCFVLFLRKKGQWCNEDTKTRKFQNSYKNINSRNEDRPTERCSKILYEKSLFCIQM